jgi:hypothetical protein
MRRPGCGSCQEECGRFECARCANPMSMDDFLVPVEIANSPDWIQVYVDHELLYGGPRLGPVQIGLLLGKLGHPVTIRPLEGEEHTPVYNLDP